MGAMGFSRFVQYGWGVIFGMLFVIFYERIPGKRILKGVVFSLTVYFITTFRGAVYTLVYGLPVVFYYLAVGGFLMFPTFGLVLGALYKKSSSP